MRRPLIVIGPLPPPVHGVTVSTSLVLANPILRGSFAVEHVDTSDHRSAANIGRWEATNILLGIGHLAALIRRLVHQRGIVYLPLSQSAAAVLRDSLFIAAAALFRWKVVAHLRGGEFDQLYGGRTWIFRVWIRFVLQRVNSIAVMGESLRGVFKGLVPPERVAVVPNGTPDLNPDGAVRDPGRVLFLSNLWRRKGVFEAAAAARIVLDQRPHAHFLFVGAWENEEVEREARACLDSFGGAVRFLGSTTGEEKRALLLSSSIMLFPPVLAEGHPRVVLEALSAGLPVVTTARGAIADTIIDGETGFVLPDPVPSKLADRILLLLDDHDLRDRMSRAARTRYRELFTQERADRVLAEWIESVAAS